MKRVDEILHPGNQGFDNLSDVPCRNSLNFENGCYVNVTALFVDMIDSSGLADFSRKPVLARIYRCFIPECVAVLSALEACQEVNIHGDCVWGVYNTRLQEDFDAVLCVAARLNSCINMINHKFEKQQYQKIKIGIGLDFGNSLMVKAGFCGSGINDVVWMGDVVNSACHLANMAGREGKSLMLLSQNFYDRLRSKYRNLFQWKINTSYCTAYGGSAIMPYMENIIKKYVIHLNKCGS